MKIIILLGFVICVLFQFVTLEEAVYDYQHLDSEEIDCLVRTEVPLNVVLEAKNTSSVLANDPRYKDFLSCYWKKYGFQNEDGTMNWEKIQGALEQTYKPSIAVQLIEKCDQIQGKTDGDTVVFVLICLDEHAPNIRAVHKYYAGHHGD